MHHAQIFFENFAFLIETSLHFLQLAKIFMKCFAHLLKKRQKTNSINCFCIMKKKLYQDFLALLKFQISDFLIFF